MSFVVFIFVAALITAAGIATLAASQSLSLVTALTLLGCVVIALSAGRKLDELTEKFSNLSLSGKKERGSVKWFNVTKGYGFITLEDGGDVFVHYRSVKGEGRRALQEGQLVEFVLSEGEKGPQAEEVSILK